MNERAWSLRRASAAGLPLVVCLMLPFGAVLGRSDLDEFKVKREAVFEFAQKPQVTRHGDRLEVRFETKGLCDVTVAVENADGRIIRHLASGVLGPNAPEPFQKNSKSQVVVWDGKDDQGVYVDDKDRIAVRVSLGLKPQFERTLFWHPLKPTAVHAPIICPAPEGVYVYQGGVCDHLRLFDHDGNYVRTIYPFAAGKVNEVQGLRTYTFPQDGRTLPLKGGFHQATLLTSGNNYNIESYSDQGTAANAVAVHGTTVALLHNQSNWLATDGTSGGRPLLGPQTGLMARVLYNWSDWKNELVPPRSATFSADGRWVYWTGYVWTNGWSGHAFDWLHVVMRMSTAGQAKPEVFAGSTKDRDSGSGDTQLNVPTSVACDARGRVYVSDFRNNRIQVYAEDRTLLKSIPFKQPAHVCVHQRTGHIYVFSWHFRNPTEQFPDKQVVTVAHLGPFEKPDPIATYHLPIEDKKVDSWDKDGGRQYRVALDSWSDPPRIWLGLVSDRAQRWDTTGLVLVEERDGHLAVKRDFRKEVARTPSVVRVKPPVLWRQRLYVNPKSGKLYVAEGDAGVMKSVKQLVEIDPTTGRVRLVDVPFDAEDFCFDINGYVYLRTDTIVVRYNPETWTEMPFDYGEERKSVGFGSGSEGRQAPVVAGVPLPGHRPGCFHMGGMWISPPGDLAVACHNAEKIEPRKDGVDVSQFVVGSKRYTPRLYPGRLRGNDIHVWDQHGRILYEDAVPGLGSTFGIGIDREDAVYVLAAPTRILDGTRYFDDLSATLIKFRPKKGKILSPHPSVPIPLPLDATPKRPADIQNRELGAAWAEGAEWFYGGVGFGGHNAGRAMGGCSCWNCRPALDYFGRSFVPETRRYSVAVLDTNGNLILRLGKYGNVEDGKPLVGEGGPANPRSIGGDEIALFHAAYLGTHTDRRLFIADAGNARLLSVTLDYYASKTVALRDVTDSR